MRRVVIAVVLGVAAGLAGTWSFVSERSPDPASSFEAPAAPGEAPAPTAVALPRAEDRARPGLWITVRANGQLVSGARVEVWRRFHDEAKGGVRWLPLGREWTDEKGSASFPAMMGRYGVRATATGRTALAEVDVVIADEPTALEVTLGAARVLSGRVIDQETTAPIAGALVTAAAQSSGAHTQPWRFPAETHVTTQADGLGRFRLELPDGLDVELQAMAPGFARGGTEVDAGDTETTISLVRAARVDGVVVDAVGQPLAGATVDSEPREAPPLVTGADGRFTLTLRPGATSLHAASSGGLQALTRVQTAAGQHLKDVRLVVAAQGDLTGRVVDTSGAGVAGVEVRVLAEPDFVELATLQTDGSGAFTAVKLPATRAALFARSGNGARARQVGLELPLAGPVELHLSGSASVEGQVVNATGQALANALVELEWSKGLGEPAVRARTDAEGRFRADDLLPGVITAHATLGDASSEDVELYLPEGQTVLTNLTLVRRGRLKGLVQADSPRRFWIFPDQADGPPQFRRAFPTDDQGRFDEWVLPGHYIVRVSSPSQVLAQHEGGVEVDIRAGETTEVALAVAAGDSNEVPESVMAPELGSGVSFDTGPGGVVISFLMSECPAQKAGLQVGDLLLSIDGEPITRTLDAFERLKRPRGEVAQLTVRRGGHDVAFTLK